MSDSMEMADRTVTDSSEREVMVEVRDLKKHFGGGFFGGPPVRAVDGVDLDIYRGETLGLVGESGCGKTTLGRTLLQLERPTGGVVRFDGRDLTELGGSELFEWRRNAQMVFQDPKSSLNDRMTVGDIIREPLDVHDWGTKREKRQRVRELLDTVGLEQDHYFRYPHQFSGGQLQRISVARTLSLEPDFIVLDEPVSALDVSVQAEIINLLEDLQDEFNLTYLFIAHDLSVVRHISDRVAVMYLGNLMEVGPTEELFTDPAHPYTHALLSAIPALDPTDDPDRILLHGTPPNPRYPPGGCVFCSRCPARIRPDEYEALDDAIWNGLLTLRDVIAERDRAELTIRERIRLRLGRESRFSTMDELLDELFGDMELPTDVRDLLAEMAHHVENNDEAMAIEVFDEAFGSVCEAEVPEDYTIGDAGRTSHCHRHDPSYPEPAEVIQERYG